MRKWIIALLCITLICSLAGCSSSDKEKEVEKGRFLENTIELPQFDSVAEFYGTTYDSQGRLCFLVSTGKAAACKLAVYTQKDNGYEKKDITNLEKWFKDGHYMGTATLGEDGKWYIMLVKMYYKDKNGKTYTDDSIAGEHRTYSSEEYKKIAEFTKGMTEYQQNKLFCDGKDISPASWVEGRTDVYRKCDYVDHLHVNKDGVVEYENTTQCLLMKYDPKTKKEEKITSTNYQVDIPVYMMGNTLYTCTRDNASGKSKINIYDLNTMAFKSIDMDISIMDEDQARIFVDKNETIYILTKKGIYKHQKNGTLWEQILQADKYSFSGHNVMLDSIVIDKDGKIGVMTWMTKTRKSDMYQYYFDENAVAKPSKKLTIYSLWESGTIREAIRKYQLKNPDIEVEFTVADQENTNKSQLIQKLNTEILAGKGADIIITDGLNRTSYEKKGVLEDLSDVVDSKSLVETIANNYTKDGKLYGIPLKVSVPVIVSETDMKEALSSMEKLSEYSKSQKKLVFTQMDATQLLEKLLYTYGHELFTDDGTLDKNKLSKYLEQARTIIGHSEVEDPMDISKQQQDTCWADSIYLEDGATYISIYSDLLKGSAIVSNQTSPLNISIYETLRKEEGANYTSFNNEFISNGVVSVNTNGKMKEEAKNLVKYLFSDEIQQLDCGDGYPVTKTALENWKSSYVASGLGMGGVDKDDNIISYRVDPPDENTRRIGVEMVEHAKQQIFQDATIINMIMEQSDKYMKGLADLNSTVNTIIQKVDRYLEEQK